MAGKADTGIKVIPVKNNLGRSLLVMTCYVLILPPGEQFVQSNITNLCVFIFTLQMAKDRSRSLWN